MKIYPQYKCCYTLPGEDWSWIDTTEVQAVCVARNGSGLVVMLSVLSAPVGSVIDEKFAAGFEPDGYPSVQKRGGRITTFKGLPCYECEWI